MIKILIRILVVAATLLAISQSGCGITVDSIYSAIIVSLIWGLFGLTVRPLLGLLTLPINILTLGLFSFVLNALLFWFISTFVAGFHVAGFIPALLGSVILTGVSWGLQHLFSKE